MLTLTIGQTVLRSTVFSVCDSAPVAVAPGLGSIGDQVSADPEDPANYDLFAGLEITFKRIGSLFTDHLLHIFRLIWS